ncbi:MAG TPA: hypothetical protein VIA07_02255 [Desulfuromonadales bacterium]|jgi:hypothetical protein
MRARLRPILLLLAVLSLVSACRPTAPPQSSVSAPAPTPVSVPAPVLAPAPDRSEDRSAAPEPAPARQNIRQQLAAANFPAALALILASGLSEGEVAEEYGRTLKGVLKQAEGYLEKELPEKAGPLYRAALDGYPKTPAVAARVGTRPAGITAGIEACADQLMERGLASYRSGNLDRAIADWKLIRAFAPRHQASRKALQTAEVQLANLKKVRAEQ